MSVQNAMKVHTVNGGSAVVTDFHKTTFLLMFFVFYIIIIVLYFLLVVISLVKFQIPSICPCSIVQQQHLQDVM